MTEELLTAEIFDEDLHDVRKKRLREKMSEREAAPEVEEEAAGERAGTEYVLLRLLDQLDHPGGWMECGRSAGPSGRAALNALVDDLGEGTYIAVPARSWQPMTVTVETKIRIS